ncbi:MAG: hypothetical protein R3E94_19210 [Burkholderiaceae bacterium]
MNRTFNASLLVSVAILGLAGCGGGGGDEEQDVYQKASREYACFDVSGTFVENLHMNFNAEAMHIQSNGQVVITAANPSQTDGGYGYATALPDSRLLGLVMYPNGKEIAGQRYDVIYAFTYPGTTAVNAFSSRLCQ